MRSRNIMCTLLVIWSVSMSDRRVCWPYVDMAGSLEASARRSKTTASAIPLAYTSLSGSFGIPSVVASPSTAAAI
ncbi:unnamed protein product [Periconia digitata]|uniref:Secreted protein n=1 Tax=Periconia digitata TaxID=1303443 RepID=A0A9W4XPV7_9PLEO|nr:unnamed protein product [Periconia digitata]